MPTVTVVERRDRAIIAFLFLTGSRDDAATTLRLCHVDLVEGCVHFDGRDVRTKRSKSFTTWFFPVGDDVRQIVVDWITAELQQIFGYEKKADPVNDPHDGRRPHSQGRCVEFELGLCHRPTP